MAEAAAARPGHNGPDGTLLNEMMKSWWRIEDDKNSMRQQHRTKVGKLTEQQGEVIARVKDGGLNVRAFKELLNEEKDRRRVENRKAKLEDEEVDELDAMRDALGAFADSPLGRAALGEEQGEDDVRSLAQKKREKARKDKNAALDAVASSDAPEGNGSDLLAAGLKTLN